MLIGIVYRLISSVNSAQWKTLSDFSEWTSLEAAFILGKLFYGDFYAG